MYNKRWIIEYIFCFCPIRVKSMSLNDQILFKKKHFTLYPLSMIKQSLILNTYTHILFDSIKFFLGFYDDNMKKVQSSLPFMTQQTCFRYTVHYILRREQNRIIVLKYYSE